MRLPLLLRIGAERCVGGENIVMDSPEHAV